MKHVTVTFGVFQSELATLYDNRFRCVYTLKVVQLCGRSRVMRSGSAGSGNAELSLVIAAVVLPLPTLTELIVDSSAFVVRLGVDLVVLHCDTR